MLVHRDTRESEDQVPKYWPSKIHSEDILSLAYQEPCVLASCSYDGDIVLWDADMQHHLFKLNAVDQKARNPKNLRCDGGYPHTLYNNNCYCIFHFGY